MDFLAGGGGALAGIAAAAALFYARRDARSERRQVRTDERRERQEREEELEIKRSSQFVAALQEQLAATVHRLDRLDTLHAEDRRRWYDELTAVRERLSVCEEDRASLHEKVWELQTRQRRIAVAIAIEKDKDKRGAGSEFLYQTGFRPREGQRRESDEGPPDGVEERRVDDRRKEQ